MTYSPPTLLLRSDLGKKPYRLRCRFSVDAFPRASWLEKAKHAAAEAFVQDMAKQGFEYLDQHGVTMTGPFSATPITGLPSRRERGRFNARQALPAVLAGNPLRPPERSYAVSVPLLDESEKWEYELAAVFIHKTLFVETPDKHEEEEMLRKR